MPYLLHLETATTVCSVAISDGEQLLALKELDEGYTHAENLTVFVEEVLKEAKVDKGDLSAVVVTKGPGSYTGLRIGVSTAKGLCYALNLPLIAINSLESMAWGAAQKYVGKGYQYCPMIDARRMEVYTALYDESGKELKPVAAEIIEADFLAKELQEQKIIFFGNGAMKCQEVIDHPNAIFDEDLKASAASMRVLAVAKFKHEAFEDLAYFEPYYLKEFVAGSAR